MRRLQSAVTLTSVAVWLLMGLSTAPVTAQPMVSPGSDEVLGSNIPPLGDGCEDSAVIKDDGIPEIGYGWVPTAIYGIYVQVYDVSEFAQPTVDEVCVCWRRSRDDDSIDFEIVFYRDADGQPEEEPFAAVAASLDDVPDLNLGGPPGRFAKVATPGVHLPTTGPVYIGVRWDPSADQFFFACDDQTPETERVNIWFRDDRAEGWDNADETNDSIFIAHRALLVRPVGSLSPITDVPLMDGRGLALLVTVLLGAGLWVLRRDA